MQMSSESWEERIGWRKEEGGGGGAGERGEKEEMVGMHLKRKKEKRMRDSE